MSSSPPSSSSSTSHHRPTRIPSITTNISRRPVKAALSFTKLQQRTKQYDNRQVKERLFQERSKLFKKTNRLKKKLLNEVTPHGDNRDHDEERNDDEEDESQMDDVTTSTSTTTTNHSTATNHKTGNDIDHNDINRPSISQSPITYTSVSTNSGAIRARLLEMRSGRQPTTMNRTKHHNKNHAHPYITHHHETNHTSHHNRRQLSVEEKHAIRNSERNRMMRTTKRGQPHLDKQIEVLYSRLLRQQQKQGTS